MQAVQHCENKAIFVRAFHAPEGNVVIVQDLGQGIPETVLIRWAEPFASDRKDGLGLGLAISEAIAHQHSGQLNLENLPSGARATLILPEPPKVGP